MYRILVPVDDNEERATAQLETLRGLPVDAGGLSVTLLYVYEDVQISPDEGGATFIDDLNRSLDEIRDPPPTLDRFAAALDEAGIAYDRQERVGEPGPTILEAADDVDADAILLGMRTRSPVGKVLFGSVSQGVLLGADRPVIVARD